jgi:hypothetical protein
VGQRHQGDEEEAFLIALGKRKRKENRKKKKEEGGAKSFGLAINIRGEKRKMEKKP